MAGHRLAGNGVAQGITLAFAFEITRPLPAKALAAETRLLPIIPGRDGELVVAHGADDVPGFVLSAKPAACRGSVEEPDLAAEPDVARLVQLNDPLNRTLIVRR